jgi:hypothetical protein
MGVFVVHRLRGIVDLELLKATWQVMFQVNCQGKTVQGKYRRRLTPSCEVSSQRPSCGSNGHHPLNIYLYTS